MSVDTKETITELFREFAVSARGRSTVYQRLASAVAGDDDVLEFVASLPSEKWQPNLLFGAVRFLRDTVQDPTRSGSSSWPSARTSSP